MLALDLRPCEISQIEIKGESTPTGDAIRISEIRNECVPRISVDRLLCRAE